MPDEKDMNAPEKAEEASAAENTAKETPTEGNMTAETVAETPAAEKNGTVAAEAPAEAAPEKTPRAENDPKPEEPATYAFQWDYRTQYERETKEKKTLQVRAGLVYGLLVTAIFAVAIAVLVIVLAFGPLRAAVLPEENESSDEGTIEQVYTERVVYVNGDGDAEEGLAVEAAVAKMLPSSVSVLVKKATGASGVGSGVVFSEDGYILTNHHVIDGAAAVTVRLYGGARYNAELVGADETSDIALLKIPKRGLTPAEFGDSDALLIGETVMAIGAPTGVSYSETVTKGIVSCKARAVKIYGESGTLSHTLLMVQTDASVNPGNSGGPLFDRNGEVIGLVTQKTVFYEDGLTYYADGMGLAIPSNALVTIAMALKNGETPDRSGFLVKAARLGISGATVTTGGVRVEGVTSERFDAAKKLQVGDVITAVNGISVTNISDLLSILEDYVPGASIQLTVVRDTKVMGVTLILGSDDLV